jgi:hypothetical protein
MRGCVLRAPAYDPSARRKAEVDRMQFTPKVAPTLGKTIIRPWRLASRSVRRNSSALSSGVLVTRLLLAVLCPTPCAIGQSVDVVPGRERDADAAPSLLGESPQELQRLVENGDAVDLPAGRCPSSADTD